MWRNLLALVAAVALVASSPAWAKDSKARSREKIDRNAKDALARLFEESRGARTLYDDAYGYAVFSNFKVSLGVTGGGGRGVAVEKGSGKRTYMSMGTGGLNVGLGAQKYQVVFLFQTRQVFESFVEKGWQAETGANAVAGPLGANAGAAFRNGMAVYQLTQGGLMLQADVTGTKYWKDADPN